MPTTKLISCGIYARANNLLFISDIDGEKDDFSNISARLKLACQGILTACFMALSIYCVAVVIVSIDAVRLHERAIIITGER